MVDVAENDLTWVSIPWGIFHSSDTRLKGSSEDATSNLFFVDWNVKNIGENYCGLCVVNTSKNAKIKNHWTSSMSKF